MQVLDRRHKCIVTAVDNVVLAMSAEEVNDAIQSMLATLPNIESTLTAAFRSALFLFAVQYGAS